jgi:molecular chaperone DnaJ
MYIEVPKKLSDEQEALLRDLAELEHAQVTPHRKSFFEKIRDYFSGHEASADEQPQDEEKDKD